MSLNNDSNDMNNLQNLIFLVEQQSLTIRLTSIFKDVLNDLKS